MHSGGQGRISLFTPKPLTELMVDVGIVVFHMRKLRLSRATEPGRKSILAALGGQPRTGGL